MVYSQLPAIDAKANLCACRQRPSDPVIQANLLKVATQSSDMEVSSFCKEVGTAQVHES